MRLPVRMPTPGHLRRFVASGLPFAFNTMALTVVPRLDTVILATFSLTAAGYFALGDRVLGPAQIIPVVASTALYPFLAREAPGSTAARRISVGMMALGCGLALGGAVLAPWAVPTIFGSSYRPAIGVVQVMFFALPFVYASNPLIAHLYTTGRERRVLFATLAAAAVGTAAIVVGQVTVGVVGAAAGYVFRQALFTAALAITAGIRGAGAHSKPADPSVLEVAGDHEADA
jgi:O-antigen/teichoic acid export membrane protein